MKSNLIGSIIFFLLFSCSKQDAPESTPTVITLDVMDVKLNSFKMTGDVTNEGFSAAKDRGFVWSQTNQNPSVSDNKISVGYGKGQYFYILDKLIVNTTYYYRAFATNDKGTSYGELKTVKTADYSLASLITDLPKNITYTSVEVGGNVTDDGGIPVTEKGICLSNFRTPTIEDIKIPNGKGLGSFANIVIKLLDGTNYIVRAYAINGKGVSYGNEQKFSTISIKTPTLSTYIVQNISSTYATLYGNISDNGGSDIIEKGFCLSKTPNSSISDIKVKASNNEMGDYAIVITGLDPLSKYYIKAYAQNSKGISYGQETSFSTLQATTPIVGTNEFQEITLSSVKAGVEIISNGGADITEFGVCLSPERNPSIFDRKVILGTSNSQGKMENIYGLNSNSTYYLRGYAINRIGISYGPEKSFTTINNIQNSLKNGLEAYYPFNGNTNDLSKNINHAFNEGANFTFDRFNNSNRAIEFPNNGVVRTGQQLNDVFNNFTISVWAFTKKTTPEKIQGLLSSSPQDTDGPPIVHPTHGSTWDSQSAGVGIIFGTNQIQIIEHASFYIYFPLVYSGNFQGWNHIVIVYENKIPKLYLNGKLMVIGVQSRMPLVRPSNGFDTALYYQSGFGKSFFPSVFNPSKQFSGYIDDFAIWNRALSSTEIIGLNQIDFQP